MKRHHSRQAQQILTLSLMGSLALLAACGGGGKGEEPAAAAPAAVEVHEPSIVELADPNEPYILSESYSETQGDGNKYQLNLIDGITQQLRAKILFPSSTAGKWVTVNRIERKPVAGDSFATTDVDKGPSTLYYVMQNVSVQVDESGEPVLDALTKLPIHNTPGGKVFQFNLSRNSTLTAQQISALTNACSITSTYNTKQDGTESALLVTTAGDDKQCGDSKSKIELERHQVDDNTTYIVKTNDATTAPTRLAKDTATYKPLAYLYEANSLTGILAQHTIDKTTAQLDVLSPTMDTALVEGVDISNGSKSTPFKTYTIDTAKADEIGVEWISRAPRSYANGYLRIQGSEIVNIIKVVDGKNVLTPTTVPFNRLYQFTWNGATLAAGVSLNNSYALNTGVKSNIGITDDKYVYFANGSALAAGPFDSKTTPGAQSFQSRPNEFSNFTEKVVKLYQTAKYVVVVQQGSTGTQVRGIDKQTGEVNVLVSGGPAQKLSILGIQGDSLVYTMAVDTDSSGIHLNSVPIAPSGNLGFATSAQLLNGIFVQSVVTDNTLTYGEKNLSRVITCKPSSLLRTNCLNAPLKVYDLASQQLTKELGTLKIEDSTNITVEAPEALVGNTDVFRIKKILPDGVSTSLTPWLFHSGVKGSLKELDTFTATNAPSVLN